MRYAPDGIGLLATANKVLRETLLPELPAQHRHDALMVANAMSIAMRQLEQGDRPLQDELQSLKDLGFSIRQGGAASSQANLTAALKVANSELAAALRHGDADPGRSQRPAILKHLRAVAEQGLKESNPKYRKG